jgi:hypothetical protein
MEEAILNLFLVLGTAPRNDQISEMLQETHI